MTKVLFLNEVGISTEIELVTAQEMEKKGLGKIMESSKRDLLKDKPVKTVKKKTKKTLTTKD